MILGENDYTEDATWYLRSDSKEIKEKFCSDLYRNTVVSVCLFCFSETYVIA